MPRPASVIIGIANKIGVVPFVLAIDRRRRAGGQAEKGAGEPLEGLHIRASRLERDALPMGFYRRDDPSRFFDQCSSAGWSAPTEVVPPLG